MRDRLGPIKLHRAPEVIVAKETRSGTITVPEKRDDTQLTFFTAIQDFGNSIPPLIVSESETYEKSVLAEQNCYENHDYIIRNTQQNIYSQTVVNWFVRDPAHSDTRLTDL
jgi:hypothetical protein